MSGKKGMKGWRKRDEWDWRELVGENHVLLIKLAKKFRIDMDEFTDEKIERIMNDPNKRKLFFKSLDIASAIVVKSLPTKINGEGIAPNITIQWKDSKDEELSLLR